MRPQRRLGGSVLAISLGLLVHLGVAGPAPAQEKSRRPPARGWVVDRVRVENLDPGGFLTVGGHGDYRGVVEVVRTGGAVAVINELPLEEYLLGITEMPTNWPDAALQAQAVAARTYALHHATTRLPTAAREVGADICATDACQVYTGLGRERAEGARRWLAAVEATRGQVLLHRGAPILAMYSSSNGGQSVAGGRPYLRSVKDPDDARSPQHRWRVVVPYDQVGPLFSVPGPVTGARRTGDLVILDWAAPEGPSGHIDVPASDFRARLNDTLPSPGPPRALPSNRFSVHADDGARAVVVEGSGWGHGVGMSQYGALGKASRGMRASEILAAYYGGIRPTAVAPEGIARTVRVALDTERSSVDLGGSGRFRVTDGEGRPLAVAASGAWRVVPGPSKHLRLLPPSAQEAPAVLEPLGIDPAEPGVGVPMQIRFRVSPPALVAVRVDGPGGPVPVASGPTLLEAGEAALALPALPAPGAYTVTIAGDVGAGRITEVPVSLTVPDPRTPEAASAAATGDRPHRSLRSPPRQGTSDRRPAGVLAAILLMGVAVALGRQRWRMNAE